MPKENHYDIIIAGAGAAGLSLLWHLIQSPLKNHRILVADHTLATPPLKTWCFWEEDHPFMELVHRSWNHLEVISGGHRFGGNPGRFQYHAIRADRFQEAVLSEARNCKTVTLADLEILSIGTEGGNGVIETNCGRYTAEWVFQSIFPPGRGKYDNTLIQHFAGIDIESDRPAFNPDSAILMDFDTMQRGGLTFFYLLPFSKYKAMVEYTLFTDSVLDRDQYDNAIEQYLLERHNLKPDEYRKTRREEGQIPMEDRIVPVCYNERCWNLGIAGGVSKSSTGYTFSRIQRHSRKIVDSLVRRGAPPQKTGGGSTFRFRLYDMLILYLLKHEQESARIIFHELFRNNSLERVLLFLDEQTDPATEFTLFSSLPLRPFIRSIWKMKHRLLNP